MKPLPILLVGLVSGSAAAALTLQLVDTADAASPVRDAPADPVETAALTRLEERLAEIHERQERLAADLVALASRPADAAPARTPVGELEAAVERVLARRTSDPEAGGGAKGNAPAIPDVDGELTVDTVVARLLANEFGSYEDEERFWQEVREAGLVDGVLEAFKERAEAAPNDPEVQIDLGEVYLQKVFEAGQGPMAGKWATLADQAFDQALQADDRHWEARFTKATSLSFWPPVFGKQAEAIHEYEILAEQQEGEVPQQRFAQTYLLLGNLYQQTGKPEKALETYRRGLELFPDDAALIDQIEVSQD